MREWLIDTLVRHGPHSLARFLGYPAFRERLELLIANLPALFVLFTLSVAAWRFRGVPVAALRVLGGCMLAHALLRAFIGYTYDTPLALLSLLLDCGTLVAVVVAAGTLVSTRLDRWERVFAGTASLALVAVGLVLLQANRILSAPTPWLHLLVSVGLAALLTRSRQRVRPIRVDRLLLCLVGASLLPLLPYAFAAAPPDADITSMSELMGYLFQGQTPSDVRTGFADERLGLRYPVGFPALGWLSAQFLNVRGAEACLLLWMLSFALFLGSLVWLARLCALRPYVVLLFSLNGVVTGTHGLHGGQAQELLAYAMGIASVGFGFSKRPALAGLCLASSLLTQPMVSAPFCPVFGWLWLTVFRPAPTWRGGLALLVPSLALAYLAVLATGPNGQTSVVSLFLTELTWEKALTDALHWLHHDSLGMPWFLLAVPLTAWRKPAQRREFSLLCLWLAGAIVLDGVFGDTRFAARPQASYSVVAIWILAVAVTLALLEDLVRNDVRWRRAVLLAAPALWLFVLAPGFPLEPVSVFTTHSDIRMGRYIEAALPKDVLIANIRPPGDDTPPHGYGFMMRANAVRDVIHARIFWHHIKTGALSERRSALDTCYEMAGPALLTCVRSFGATHLVVDARPTTAAFVASLGTPPQQRFGETYLFDLARQAPQSSDTTRTQSPTHPTTACCTIEQ